MISPPIVFMLSVIEERGDSFSGLSFLFWITLLSLLVWSWLKDIVVETCKERKKKVRNSLTSRPDQKLIWWRRSKKKSRPPDRLKVHKLDDDQKSQPQDIDLSQVTKSQQTWKTVKKVDLKKSNPISNQIESPNPYVWEKSNSLRTSRSRTKNVEKLWTSEKSE